mmetsp:Transcript_15733/g.37817  ORF Transcript_15733/g.37817 Transcript_15733/m.37817 type:complete len:802 (+) Transcript_15733:300-2705(+)
MTDAITKTRKDLLACNMFDEECSLPSIHSTERPPITSTRRPHLPVLIIPGFMSSGLEVIGSDHMSNWEGKRLWLNLKSLGLGKIKKRGENGIEPCRRASLSRSNAQLFYNEFNKDKNDDDEDVDTNDDDDVEVKEVASTNIWIKHISLMDDLKSDPPGVEVRAMEGLKGVDYLTHGALTSFMSYVFGPVIKVLSKFGYREGINLDASPYDWRLPPSELERRDAYFTKTMRKVERLSEKGGGLPVVLVCHSLGCKVAEYFLEFANARDESWCTKYIHTYMPVGAPHLGAPFALRGIVSGDKMGLDAFLNEHEALAMSRSLGSVPWLIPSLVPPYAPANVIVRREGAFEVCVNCTVNVKDLFDNRAENSIPEKLELGLRCGRRYSTTNFQRIVDGKVTFKRNFIFATPPEGPPAEQRCSRCCPCCILTCACCGCCSDNHLIVSVREPGLKKVSGNKIREHCKKKFCSASTNLVCLKIFTCWYIVKWVLAIAGYCLYVFAYKLRLKVIDFIYRSSGRSSQLALGAPIDLREYVGATEGIDVVVELHNDLKQPLCCRYEFLARSTTVTVNIRWVSPDVPANSEPNKCQLAELGKVHRQQHIGFNTMKGKKEFEYETSSGYEILKKEGLDSTINAVCEIYGTDPLNPRSSGSRPPPVKNIKAIYGINLPTEVGAVYRRKGVFAERKKKVKPRYAVDEDAHQIEDRSSYMLDDGVLLETRETPQMIDSGTVRCSGDGTVPYWSLQHVKTWKDQCNVDVTELDGAKHREILADKRFHDLLIEYVTVDNSKAWASHLEENLNLIVDIPH